MFSLGTLIFVKRQMYAQVIILKTHSKHFSESFFWVFRPWANNSNGQNNNNNLKVENTIS